MTTVINGDDNFDTGTSIPNFIEGLVWQNDTVDVTNDFIVSAGKCRNGSLQFILTAAQTKRMDASWSAGDGGGALATGATAFSNTGQTYYIFAMQVGGVDEIGVDSDVTGANLVANHAATIVRRIGSVPPQTAASTLGLGTNTELAGGAVRFSHDKNRLAYTGTTGSVTATADIPNGIEVIAHMIHGLKDSGATWARMYSSLSTTAGLNSTILSHQTNTSALHSFVALDVVTNDGQISTVTTASPVLANTIRCSGYTDPRSI